MRTLLSAAALVAGAAVTSAQGQLDLVADQAASNFTWSGTTSLGPIVGDPGNAFQVAGHNGMTLAVAGAGAKWDAAFTAGDLLVTPDIHGKIPNPIPFLPPLATIGITNLRLSLSSPPSAVALDGSFTAQVTATALSGVMTITPLAGSPTVTDLSGLSSDPGPQSGTLLPQGGGLHLAAPIDLAFDFDDPATGISGALQIVGALNADWTCPPASVYCTAKTTSSGCVPTIAVAGVPSASGAAGFDVTATQVEAGNLGILFFGQGGPAATPFQGGFLCVAPPVTRLAPQPSGGAAACSGVYTVDFNAYLAASQPLLRVPGLELCVQAWFRDPPEPVSGSGLTDAARFTLCP